MAGISTQLPGIGFVRKGATLRLLAVRGQMISRRRVAIHEEEYCDGPAIPLRCRRAGPGATFAVPCLSVSDSRLS